MANARYVASRVGALPAAGAATVGGVALPEGVRPMPVSEHAMHPARAKKESPLWVTAEPVPGVGKRVAELAEKHRATGLWPAVLSPLRNAPKRPWHDGELDPSGASDPTHNDPRAVLDGWWADALPIAEDGESLDTGSMGALAPFGRAFPGLAKERLGAVKPLASALGDLEGALGLAAALRPADFVAAVGWLGPINHFSDMGMLASVLRSWEDRFDAYVVGVGFDTLTLAVGRPAVDRDQAIAIAAEHFAVCSDVVYQGEGSIEALAETLVGAEVWTFWWD